MLVIREEQIQQLIAPDEPSRVRLIRNVVREANPDRVANYSDQLLDSMIRTGILRAESRGFSLAEDLAGFVAVMFEIAPNFDMQSDIDTVFNDTSHPPTDRLKYLWERVPEGAWAEAEASYDLKIWFPEQK